MLFLRTQTHSNLSDGHDNKTHPKKQQIERLELSC